MYNEIIGVRFFFFIICVSEVRGSGSGSFRVVSSWGLRGCRGLGMCVFGGVVVGVIFFFGGGCVVRVLLSATCICSERIICGSKNRL